MGGMRVCGGVDRGGGDNYETAYDQYFGSGVVGQGGGDDSGTTAFGGMVVDEEDGQGGGKDSGAAAHIPKVPGTAVCVWSLYSLLCVSRLFCCQSQLLKAGGLCIEHH